MSRAYKQLRGCKNKKSLPKFGKLFPFIGGTWGVFDVG
jgi:hypothetical protein